MDRSENPFRKCLNVKSKRYPDTRCNASAIHGEFCARHYKKPYRYSCLKKSEKTTTYSVIFHRAATKIQKFFRTKLAALALRRQGPSANCLDLAENKTELQSMDAVQTIPKLYIWSYADESKHIWAFDIRSFSHIIAGTSSLKNPYTQLPLTESAKLSLEKRLNWLKKRRYATLFMSDTELTAEQAFSLRILDIFMKMDFLGYHSDTSWFTELDNTGQINLYKELYDLWFYRLQLTPSLKKEMCPDLDTIMKYDPYKVSASRRARPQAWKKINATIMDMLVSCAADKTNRALGAMYCLTALCKVSTGAAEAYEWLS